MRLPNLCTVSLVYKFSGKKEFAFRNVRACKYRVLEVQLNEYETAPYLIKVHIFREGHKILRNLHQLLAVRRTNNWWRFRKILWPSQNI